MLLKLGKSTKDISVNATKKKLPDIVPLDEVLDCMKDEDPIIASAGRVYYRKHYNNG